MKKIIACCTVIACSWCGLSNAADMTAVLDSEDGSSAFVVTDSQTTQVLRATSDGVVVVNNIVDGISGERPVITVTGGQDVQIGADAEGYSSSVAIGGSANGSYEGTAVGVQSKGQWYGAGFGYQADGANQGAAVGRQANGNYYGAALGNGAQGTNWGVAVGASANGSDNGVALGNSADGHQYGVGIGRNAQGGSYSVAIGNNAKGTNGGAAVGSNADASNFGAALGGAAHGDLGGAAVGNNANAYSLGVAVGGASLGQEEGVAIGNMARGYAAGIAVGYIAKGYNTNIAIGVYADTLNGRDRVAIGNRITNEVDNTTRVRGSLYLDGGTTVFGRATVGSGPWDDLLGTESLNAATSFVQKTGDTMTGPLVISEAMLQVVSNANRGAGDREMLSIGGGRDVEIGHGANGYNHGVAVGYFANGGESGVAVGDNAKGADYGVGLGNAANATNHGVVVGAASGWDKGAVVGDQASGQQSGVALGYFANGIRTNVAIGAGANAGGGNKRIAIGPSVVNDVDDSARLRGTLYLDGGTAVLYRSTFGSGNWTSLADVVTGRLTNYVQKTGDSMFGALNIQSAAMSVTSNRGGVYGLRSMLEIKGGGDVEIGAGANGYYYGVAVGNDADAYYSGVALGYAATGNLNGVALGAGAKSEMTGVAVGYNARGSQEGVGIGLNASAATSSVAIGIYSASAHSNIAIGYWALAKEGSNRIAIGAGVSNNVDSSAFLRGTLYLDGGTAVLYRATFGSGAWTSLGDSFVKKTGDTMTGPLNIVTNVNRGAGARPMVIIGGGEDIEIGLGANGYWFGVAAGSNANAYSSGVALGYEADGSREGVAVGYKANGKWDGAALGWSANGLTNGTALGRQAQAANGGAAVGFGAQGGADGAAVGRLSDGSIGGAAVGYEANGALYGAALGMGANGYSRNVAVGAGANAYGASGIERTAIGYNVTNTVDSSVRVRGTLYIDGTGAADANIKWRQTFGTGGWSTKTFVIDHPLDPENKVLRHYCMEGPDVWNVYAGNAQLVNGEAVVELPDYYAALNKAGSEIYSLTPVGDLAQICVKEKASGNRFVIRGDKDVEVSWTIKVLRNDPACVADLAQRPVEQLKSEVPEEQIPAENRGVNTFALTR